jgi:hypothetical protein
VRKFLRLIIVVSLVFSALILVSGISCSNDQDSLLLSYQRSGGLAGLLDQLTIYSDGHCELQRKDVEREFTLQSSQLAHLEALMEEANLPDLEGDYFPTDTGADYFEYVISYQTEDGKMHRVRAITGAVPDALQPILDELDQLISSNS